MRKAVNGTLYVDGKKVATGRASGGSTSVDGLKALYLGGTPEDFDAKRVTVSGAQFFCSFFKLVHISKSRGGR